MSHDAPVFHRKVTARDVAERAGVSKWTVSRAFTEGASVAPEVRERVLRVAAEIGYSPNLLARSLTTQSSRLIALVVDELGNPNQLNMLNEATRQLQARGYSSLLLNLSQDVAQTDALRLAVQFQVDGIMFMGTTLDESLIEMAQKVRHVPLVVVMRSSSVADIPSVTVDGYAAGQEVADLLLAQGCTRIGYMAGPHSVRTELRRLEGFKDRLKACGVPLAAWLEASRYRRDHGLQTLLRHLESTPRAQRLEAVFCENDILAIGALDALAQAGLDRKMSIVGFDDIELAASPHFDLTTFRQPAELLVQEAVRRLIDTARQALGSVMMPGSLVLRSSHRRML